MEHEVSPTAQKFIEQHEKTTKSKKLEKELFGKEYWREKEATHMLMDLSASRESTAHFPSSPSDHR